MSSSSKNSIPIFVVSGGKGIAGHTMVHSLIIQYPDNKFTIKVIPDVQSEEQIIDVVQKVKSMGGIITHTMVSAKLRHRLIKECKTQGVKEFDFMGPLADYIENEMGYMSIGVPGLYRRVNAKYFDRIEAIEFTMNHDDGVNPKRLRDAEIILCGVSRSGKTPLSVYMAMFGWKVANVPIVKGIEPPEELFKVDPKRVFGLTINSSHLIAQRYKRLSQLGNFDSTNYVDEKSVREDLMHANMIFERGGFTKINVTSKPIESTANEIIGIISDRFYSDEEENERTVKGSDLPL